MTEVSHDDVAMFVAGALEPAEDAAFVEHLADCEACHAEIAWMSELAAAVVDLGPAESGTDTDADTEVDAKPDSAKPDSEPAAVVMSIPAPRRRVHWLAAAAAAVLLVAGGVTGFLVGHDNAPAVQADPVQVLFDSGTIHHAADGPVSADVAVVSDEGGIDVGLRLVDPAGPKSCELVVVSRDGTERTAMSWLVPTHGFNSNTPLRARGTAGVRAEQISHFEIRASGRLVLSIPA